MSLVGKRNNLAHGVIKDWDDEKAYGFIEPSAGGKDVFVHLNGFLDKSNRPQKGQLVAYSLAKGKDNRLCAARVQKAGDRVRKKRRGRSSSKLLTAITVTLFLSLLIAVVTKGYLSVNIFYLYLVASVITFFAYANDKSAAQNDRWRTPESTLHLFALIGGWPGALIAQQVLRHKSKKEGFRIVCWITVVINIIAFCWLFTAQGQAVQSIFDSNRANTNGVYIEWSKNE